MNRAGMIANHTGSGWKKYPESGWPSFGYVTLKNAGFTDF